jgi:hypothetical protein
MLPSYVTVDGIVTVPSKEQIVNADEPIYSKPSGNVIPLIYE